MSADQPKTTNPTPRKSFPAKAFREVEEIRVRTPGTVAGAFSFRLTQEHQQHWHPNWCYANRRPLPVSTKKSRLLTPKLPGDRWYLSPMLRSSPPPKSHDSIKSAIALKFCVRTPASHLFAYTPYCLMPPETTSTFSPKDSRPMSDLIQFIRLYQNTNFHPQSKEERKREGRKASWQKKFYDTHSSQNNDSLDYRRCTSG